MDTRRDFIKKAMLLSGATAAYGAVPESIRKALAINPAPGSTYLDAEHVVILMQENRSFDHCFGTLKGVRGFNDPRAIQLPNGNPVWLQSNAAGETYAPFRFDIRDTKITWMGSIPHSRSSQLDANNFGKYDRWLDAKRSGNKDYAPMPLTLGYYTREDLPFNYALADAFTICDQNFSSAMTSTWPNRLYLWSGTIRPEQNGECNAYIHNVIPEGEGCWTTFPELLEKNDVSWKVYQNDVMAGGGFSGEERAWLSNFGCNLLEKFARYNVEFSPRCLEGLKNQVDSLPHSIESLKKQLADLPADSKDIGKLQKSIAAKEAVLAKAREGLAKWSPDSYRQLEPELKNLHEKAFTTNTGDPDYHRLERLEYEVDGEKRQLEVPKGDILHQFRQDVNSGQLPKVSWLVGPEKFSDHPTAPWFGSWYVSEVLDILTKNPQVWEKTIFIMTYDENDGYFDHVPPFVAPDPRKPETGKCSAGIDSGIEYTRREKELAQGVKSKDACEGPAGLGFRVPMVIASPWSRGGRVCSQVFDHTSVFRFVQGWLNGKSDKKIQETNVSLWRKTVSGDLTAAFHPYHGENEDKLPRLERDVFLEAIYNAKFKSTPVNFKSLSPEEIAQISSDPAASSLMARQEPGVKPSCALPYQLYAEGRLSEDRQSVVMKMEARNEIFGERSAGSPFNIFLPGKCLVAQGEGQAPAFEKVGSRSYAVIAGDSVTDSWPLKSFENGQYHLCVHGPNGFFRECRGDGDDPDLLIDCGYQPSPGNPRQLTGSLRITCDNRTSRPFQVVITDHAYKSKPIRHFVHQGQKVQTLVLDLGKSHGWYDFGITVEGFEHFAKRYAGRVETGHESISDPCMGRII